MQSPGAISDDEGLYERKPYQNGVNSLRSGEHQNCGRTAASEPEKQKKTFGRTPDGVGKSMSLSIIIIHASSRRNRLLLENRLFCGLSPNCKINALVNFCGDADPWNMQSSPSLKHMTWSPSFSHQVNPRMSQILLS